jgi:phosphoribosylformylglycinamidine synthase
MRFAVLQFPGSNCDQDCVHVLGNVLGQDADYLWHKEESIGDADAVVVPGGFSYGDYLRTGSIAQFSPVMNAVKAFANAGGLVIGICNGFQILCETGLLPGALVRNRSLQFRCETIFLKIPTADSPFTSEVQEGRLLRVPIAHGEGCYFADDEALAKLQADDQILFQYATETGDLTDEANPNGSLLNIAGICNKGRNVCGMMPHPERASENVLGADDGRRVFESMLRHLEAKTGVGQAATTEV